MLLHRSGLRNVCCSSFLTSVRCCATGNPFEAPPKEERPIANGVAMVKTLAATNPSLLIANLKMRIPMGIDTVLLDVEYLQKQLQGKKELQLEMQKVVPMRKELRQVTKQLQQLVKDPETNAFQIAVLQSNGEKLHENVAVMDMKLAQYDGEIDTYFAKLPNLLDDRVQAGTFEGDNTVVVQWGEDICKLGDNYPEAGTLLSSGEGGRETASDEDDLLPSTISGSAQWTLPVATHRCHSGWVAKLERSLLQYTLDSLGKDRSDGYCMNAQEGYQEVAVPNITNQSDLQFTGQFPLLQEELHQLSGQSAAEDPQYLAPNAEAALLSLMRGGVMELTQLPLRLMSHTTSANTLSLPSESVHLSVACTPATSIDLHNSMIMDLRLLLQSLCLPHRVVRLCGRETNFAARISVSVEVWFPGSQEYKSVATVSNCYDFQSRRANIRYGQYAIGDAEGVGKRTAHPHTLQTSNFSMRTLTMAIVETHHTGNGTIELPEVLWSYGTRSIPTNVYFDDDLE